MLKNLQTSLYPPDFWNQTYTINYILTIKVIQENHRALWELMSSVSSLSALDELGKP